LGPGSKLPAEREMARRYRTSRVSVREAYRSLEELGLIAIRRGAEGGAFIANVDHTPVLRSLSMMLRLGKMTHAELTEARMLVEPPIARLAARRALPEDIAELEGVLQRYEAALHRKLDSRPTDLQFHRSVADCARNLPLKVLMNSLADLAVDYISTVKVTRPMKEKVCEFHRLILDAIKAHDEDAAEAIMARHISDVQAKLAQSRQQELDPPVPAEDEAAIAQSV
jgi:GntR family transcriptional repressor for pyruvate dehydrogenase complex